MARAVRHLDLLDRRRSRGLSSPFRVHQGSRNTHNLVGGTPLQVKKKKIQKNRNERMVIELSPSGSRLSHHVCLDSDVLHELTRAGQIKPRKRASTGGHGSCERRHGFHSRESSPPRKRCWFTAFSAPLSASAFGPQLKSRALRLSPFGPAFGYHHRLFAFGPAFSLPLSGP